MLKGPYYGGELVDQAVNSVFAALIWHCQDLREELAPQLALSESLHPSQLLQDAFSTAEALRRELVPDVHAVMYGRMHAVMYGWMHAVMYGRIHAVMYGLMHAVMYGLMHAVMYGWMHTVMYGLMHAVTCTWYNVCTV